MTAGCVAVVCNLVYVPMETKKLQIAYFVYHLVISGLQPLF